jgi:hypothetical protein
MRQLIGDTTVNLSRNFPLDAESRSYILVYTDDLLSIDHEPKVAMDYLASRYTLKPGSVK